MKFLCVFLLGCSPVVGNMGYNIGPWELKLQGEQFYIYDPEATEELRRQYANAFTWWNAQLGREKFLSGGPVGDEANAGDGIIELIEVPYLNGAICGRADYSFSANGHIKNVTITLSVQCRGYYTAAAWQTVLRHEIGHALGLVRHNDDPRGLMYFKSNSTEETPRELTEEEQEVVCAIYGC